MFQLTKEEYEGLLQATDLKSQIAISSYGHGGRRKTPYAFTKRGRWFRSNLFELNNFKLSWNHRPHLHLQYV